MRMCNLCQPCKNLHAHVCIRLSRILHIYSCIHPRMVLHVLLIIHPHIHMQVRLRPSFDPSHSFLEYESILGTLLHELVHNVRGPHDRCGTNLQLCLWHACASVHLTSSCTAPGRLHACMPGLIMWHDVYLPCMRHIHHHHVSYLPPIRSWVILASPYACGLSLYFALVPCSCPVTA